MFYQYKCEECSEITELRLSPNNHIPQSTFCACGGWARRVYGGQQIHMNTWRTAIHDYNRLPEQVKEGDTSFLK